MLVIWATLASWYHLGPVAIILAMTGVVQADTSFNFSSFPTAESFLVLNDTEHSPSNASFLLNLNAATMEASCGRLLYNQTIRMKNATTGALASFHAVFTFQISGPNQKFVAAPVFYHGDGLAFTFVKVPILTDQCVESGSGLCLLNSALDPYFAIEFDTYKTEAYDDSSDSHVGVNLNSMNSTWSYNLCQDKEYCSYLCNGGYFTAWIDYYSKSQILRVFLAKGSLQETVAKPGYPLIDADISAQISKLVDEFMYVGFSSSVGMHREVHEIKSWTFTSSMTELGTAPPSSPRPSVSVSSPRSRRKKIFVGTSVAACGVVFLVLGFICYWRFSTESNPFRIFISHTGGPTGSGKNFAINLSEKLTLSKRYEVFIDREMKKGTLYPRKLFENIEMTHMAIVIVSEEFFMRKWPMIELTKFVELYELQNQPQGLETVQKEPHGPVAAVQEEPQGPVNVQGISQAPVTVQEIPQGLVVTTQEEPQGVQKKSGPVIMHTVLPLFFKLTVAQVRSRLDDGFWEQHWTKMSSEEHPIDLEKYREAVKTLCVLNGVEYNFRDDSHEAEYIEQILIEVNKIYKQWREARASKIGYFWKFRSLSSGH